MDFCMQMVKHLMLEEIKKPNPGNTLLSPLSFNALLNMVVAGTTGATLELLLKHIGSESVDEINNKSNQIMAVANCKGEGGLTITSVNAVWVDKHYQLKASYVELLKKIYDCQANNNGNFANEGDKVVEEINAWANTASRGLIENVLNKIDPTTTFILANALYFQGAWSQPFEPENTKRNKFFLLDGTTIRVPFLTSRGSYESYDYGSFDGYKVLRVPYSSTSKTSFSMYFFLPDERTGIQNLLETFNSSNSRNCFLDFDLNRTRLEVVQVPKFKFSYGVNVEETFRSMGVEIPYKGNQLDYAAMIEAPEDLPPLRTSIYQKAFIEVDEYGTKASAVTIELTLGAAMCSKPPPPKPKFVADHPFMLMIKEDISGLIFFTGIMVNPEDSELSGIPPSGRKHSRVGNGTQTHAKRPRVHSASQ